MRAPAQERADAGLKSWSPQQAAAWIRARADEHGGATLDREAMNALCDEIRSHAPVCGVDHLLAMGQALASMFNPSASSSSLSEALAAPANYDGVKALLRALLAAPQQVLSPEQAGAFIEGVRLSQPPAPQGRAYDAALRRVICDAVLAGAPTDTVIAMGCGLFGAMVDPAAKPSRYSPARLPSLPVSVSAQQRSQMQEALNMGKRLALQPCSVLGKDVPGSTDARVDWLLMAYRMPKPQANEGRFFSWQRNYRKALQGLPAGQAAQVLAAVNRTRGQGVLRGTPAGGTADRKAS